LLGSLTRLHLQRLQLLLQLGLSEVLLVSWLKYLLFSEDGVNMGWE
jgi:hypothetical protein